MPDAIDFLADANAIVLNAQQQLLTIQVYKLQGGACKSCVFLRVRVCVLGMSFVCVCSYIFTDMITMVGRW